MNVADYQPDLLLRPFIKAYKIIESEGEMTNRVLPGTSFALAFRFRGEISYVGDGGKSVLPSVAFSGLRKSVRLIHYARETSALIILFNEMGVSTFFKHPLHELFEQSASLENFFPHVEISILEQRLGEAQNNSARIRLVEQFLYARLNPGKRDNLVAEAIKRIHSTKGMIRMKELAGNLYISQDAFEKRFRKATGTRPKQFSFIVKMNAVVSQHPSPLLHLDRALENGYFDQPHFNKDFKLFTGQTPTDFFKSASYW
jgi:AraC-like DNA-binding protein